MVVRTHRVGKVSCYVVRSGRTRAWVLSGRHVCRWMESPTPPRAFLSRLSCCFRPLASFCWAVRLCRACARRPTRAQAPSEKRFSIVGWRTSGAVSDGCCMRRDGGRCTRPPLSSNCFRSGVSLHLLDLTSFRSALVLLPFNSIRQGIQRPGLRRKGHS